MQIKLSKCFFPPIVLVCSSYFEAILMFLLLSSLFLASYCYYASMNKCIYSFRNGNNPKTLVQSNVFLRNNIHKFYA